MVERGGWLGKGMWCFWTLPGLYLGQGDGGNAIPSPWVPLCPHHPQTPRKWSTQRRKKGPSGFSQKLLQN